MNCECLLIEAKKTVGARLKAIKPPFCKHRTHQVVLLMYKSTLLGATHQIAVSDALLDPKMQEPHVLAPRVEFPRITWLLPRQPCDTHGLSLRLYKSTMHSHIELC